MFNKFKRKHEEFMDKKSMTRVGMLEALGILKVTVEHASGLWISPFNHTLSQINVVITAAKALH